jgi:hypothetical protein
MYPNNNCNNCDDCSPICITFTVGGERLQPYPCAVEQAGIHNDKPYYQLYEPGCTQLADLFVWWNITTNRWEYTTSIGSTAVFCYNVNPGLYPISTNSYEWIENLSGYFIVSSVEGPCPGPLPLPDLSGLCGDEYNAACVIYTGEDIDCLGIESGMTFLEVLNIFNNKLPICDCCAKVNCVVSEWGPWGPCKCYYNESNVLVCGRETRTKTVITPPQFGGTPCPPLVEYRPCDIPDVCFTFGSYICDTDPNPTQILTSPAGLLNDKPYYLLEFDCEASDLYVWYNTATSLWHITPTLNVVNPLYQTLNNGGNYLPISNNTTQRWSFVEGGNNYLITTQTTTCPDVNICFEFVIQTEALDYTFYANIAPTNLGEGSFPIYEWTNNTAIYQPYIFTVYYDVDEDKWVYVVSNATYTTPLTWGTLDTNTFYPLSTSTVEWQSVENITGYASEMLSSTQSNCVQPPDIPCEIECGPWSECIGGTRTRTCVVTTPPSGNVPPCPPLIETEICEVPFCLPPTNVVPTENQTNVIVSFTGVSGANYYQIVYTLNGVAQPNVTGPSSPLLLPHECSGDYVGTIVTVCTNGLTSSAVPFTFESRDAEIIYRYELFNQLLINTAHTFRPDGRVYYVTVHNSGGGGANSSASDRVISYNLGSAWDLSTGVAPAFAQSLPILEYGASAAGGIRFGNNGLSLIVCSCNNGRIIRYELGTPYDLTTTAHIFGNFYQTAGTATTRLFFVDFSNNGLIMFAGIGANIYKYNLSAPWVINSGVNASTILPVVGGVLFGISFQKNGSLLFYMLSIGGVANIVKRTLSIPYDISPGSISAPEIKSLGIVIDPVQNFYDLSFRDGYKFFVSGYNGLTFPNMVRAFELTCEYDISGPIVIIP